MNGQSVFCFISHFSFAAVSVWANTKVAKSRYFRIVVGFLMLLRREW